MNSEPGDFEIRSAINSELQAVLAVITMANPVDNLLIESLSTLRSKIFSIQAPIKLYVHLKCLLTLIKPNSTSSQISSAASSSLCNIINLMSRLSTADVGDSLCLVVDELNIFGFEVTDPASEVVLMNLLNILLACMKNKASVKLSNQQVSRIVATCFRLVFQAGSRGELLQKMARCTVQELVMCIFAHLPDEVSGLQDDYTFGRKPLDKGKGISEHDGQGSFSRFASHASSSHVPAMDENIGASGNGKDTTTSVTRMVATFSYLCSILENMKMGTSAFDEGTLLCALGLIKSAIELGGQSIRKHPTLLTLVQDQLFWNLVRFGLSSSPTVLSSTCSIVLLLYHHMRTELKLQLEAFFSCVILRLPEGGYGDAYQQQKVAIEALDFCRQKNFMMEMYANLDCDITCTNVFEELVNLLSRSASPVKAPLSAMHILALEGLVAVIKGMAERFSNTTPDHWVPRVRRTKYIKRQLMSGFDHSNQDSKKGVEFLKDTPLLPDSLDPQRVACFFRYTAGLDKSLVGDVLGSDDEFCIQVLHEFALTFDFRDMRNQNTALRLFIETFRLPGETQKIQRVLKAFSQRYYEQSPLFLPNPEAALLLSYSLIRHHTDQHNVPGKKKMTEDEFIRNNRNINGGDVLPRVFLLELYESICKHTIPDQGAAFSEMTASRYIGLHKSKECVPFIRSDSGSHLDRDMLKVMSRPTIDAISAVFSYAKFEGQYKSCIDGFIAVADISALHHCVDILGYLVGSLSKFVTCWNPTSCEEPDQAFDSDTQFRMACQTVFTIANRHGDFIREQWSEILDCNLKLHKLQLLSARVASDAAEDSELSAQLQPVDLEELKIVEQQRAAQRTREAIYRCRINCKPLKAESLGHLVRELAREFEGECKNEKAALFLLEFLLEITLQNRDRIQLLWKDVHGIISSIVETNTKPSLLVKMAVFGLLRICKVLLPIKENLAEELLRSLQLLLNLHASVIGAYIVQITEEVAEILEANVSKIRSEMAWRTIMSFLCIASEYSKAGEARMKAVTFILSISDAEDDISQANRELCIDAALKFTGSLIV